MNNPKLLTTLGAQTGARLYGSRDYSAHVRSRWPFDRTTAVSQNHADLSAFVCACNDGIAPVTLNPLAEAQASISRAARILSYTVPLLSYRIPFNEPRLDLDCCLVQEPALVGSRRDGTWRLDQVFRSEISGEDNGGFRGLRATWIACLRVVTLRVAGRWTASEIARWLYRAVRMRGLTKQAPSPWSVDTAPNPESGAVIFRALVRSAQPHTPQ